MIPVALFYLWIFGGGTAAILLGLVLGGIERNNRAFIRRMRDREREDRARRIGPGIMEKRKRMAEKEAWHIWLSEERARPHREKALARHRALLAEAQAATNPASGEAMAAFRDANRYGHRVTGVEAMAPPKGQTVQERIEWLGRHLGGMI